MKRKNYRHRPTLSREGRDEMPVQNTTPDSSGGPSRAPNGAAVATLSHCESVLLPPALARIAEVWPDLPPHIWEAILTLVDSGAAVIPICDSSDGRRSRGTADEETPRAVWNNDARAWQLARKCRNIVQGGLREEEWQDSDQEFFEIMREEALRAASI